MTTANRGIDIVFCIDLSNSMEIAIDSIKNYAKSFWPELEEIHIQHTKKVSDIRVKCILFNVPTGNHGVLQSPNFLLNDSKERQNFASFVDSLTTFSNDYNIENAFTALTQAIQNDWIQHENPLAVNFVRHIIVIFTCGDSQGNVRTRINNRENNKSSFKELTDLWYNFNFEKLNNLSPRGKRLVIFGPQEYPWVDIYNNWDFVIYSPSSSCVSLNETDNNNIFNAIIANAY